ncbi:MAG: hypothetical protein VCE43_15915 [Myxococcota bacterium]
MSGSASVRLQRPHAVGLIIWVICALYLGSQTNRDWLPGDDGALGHSAERILDGELPHRDFDAIYTGGLSFLHALTFRVVGIDLLSLRIVLLAFALAWVPAVFAIARTAATPWVAGLITVSCVAWSLPNHFTAMASWYNLFFTTFGLLALLRYLETDRRGWLVAAGLCAGISVLFKSTGLGFAAGALLTLLYREQQVSFQSPRPGRSWPYQASIGLGLLGICAMLVALVSQKPTAMNALHFALPGLALCGLLAVNESTQRGHSSADRWSRLTRMGVPFGFGFLLPIALFAIPYAATSSLGDLYTGVFVLPRRRFALLQLGMPPLTSLWTAAPLAGLLILGFRRRVATQHTGVVVAAACGLGVALWMGSTDSVYRATWDSLRPTVPLLALAACALLGWRHGAAVSPERRTPLFLLTVTAALSAPVQLPYPAGIYFCYVAPLVILGIHQVVAAQPAAPLGLHGCMLVYYLLFALLWNVPGSTYQLGFRYQSLEPSAGLDLDRAGLRVAKRDADLYRRLVDEVQRHSAKGSFIYAAPNIPQIYFLSERRNPTRSLYDMFASDYGKPGHTRRLIALLDQHDVDVVVLRRPRSFARLPKRLVSVIRLRYPQRIEFAPFTVYWRPPTNPAVQSP